MEGDTSHSVEGGTVSRHGQQESVGHADGCPTKGKLDDMVSSSDLGDVIDLLEPDDLQHLYYALGLETKDIKRAESSANTHDVNLRARRVLESWCQQRGSQATREAILEALEKCRNRRERTKLEDIWKKKGKPFQVHHEFDVEVCKQELITFYKHEMSRVQLLPWCDETRDMDDIYVSLELEQTTRGGTSLLAKNEDLVTLETSQNMPATRVLVKGLAGSGKTTLLTKLAYTWSQQKRGSPLFTFDLVFVLSLREMQRGCSLIDAIFEQILPGDTEVSQNGLEIFIQFHPNKVLILLDGFDEYMAKNLSSKEGNIEKIISFKELRDCRIILSTRPYQHMGSHQSYYIPVKLTGFSPANVRLYMMKFFCGNAEMVEGLREKISESEMLKSLSTIPVILMLLCLLWKDDQNLPITQSQLYQQFTLYLWRKYCVRQRKQVHFDEEGEDFEEEFNRAISRLGEVALDGLLPQKNVTEEKLIFSEKEFGDSFQLGCETGLLTRERLRSKLNSLSVVTFLHKSFQEFCAAKFLASTDNFSRILKQLQTWDVLLSKLEMIKFCCGVVGQVRAIGIIQHAITLYRKTVDELDGMVYIGKRPYGVPKQDILPVMNMLYESQIKYDDNLIPALKSLMSVGELNVNNSHPQVLPIFHYYVRSALGLATLTAIKSVRFYFHTHDSLDVITDTLTCMPDVQRVDITFKYGDTSAANEHSINRLGVQIAGLSKLNEIKLVGQLDINVLLHHLSQSPNSYNLKSIAFQWVVFNPTNMVQFFSNLNNLESLYLSDINMTNSTSIGSPLDAIHSKLKRLELTHIDAAEAIGHISHIIPHLKELQFCDANLSEDPIRILCEFLPKASNLQVLNLSDNTVGIAIVPLAQHLQYCNNLKKLDLRRTELMEDHIKTLSEFLPKASNLQVLDLSCNTVGMAIVPLAQQLQYCNNLKELHLSHTGLMEDHIKIFSEFLPKASNLQVLNLSGNTVGMAIVPLAQQLQYCNKLEKLDLSYAHIAYQGFIELAERFASLPNLKGLRVDGNDCKNTGLNAVFKHLPHLNKLEGLFIEATVDNQCSTLVRDCLTAIGEVIPNKATFIHMVINAGQISSIQHAASKHLKL